MDWVSGQCVANLNLYTRTAVSRIQITSDGLRPGPGNRLIATEVTEKNRGKKHDA